MTLGCFSRKDAHGSLHLESDLREGDSVTPSADGIKQDS
jgi:hypothetical protein